MYSHFAGLVSTKFSKKTEITEIANFVLAKFMYIKVLYSTLKMKLSSIPQEKWNFLHIGQAEAYYIPIISCLSVCLCILFRVCNFSKPLFLLSILYRMLGSKSYDPVCYANGELHVWQGS